MSPKVIAAAILALGVAAQGFASDIKATPSHKTGAVQKVAHHPQGTKSPRTSKASFAVQYAALQAPGAGPQEIRTQSVEEEFTRNSCCP